MAEKADDSGERIPSAQIVPRQLPASVRDFVGRPAELATLTRLLDEAGNAVGVVVISTIGGVAGVGKTALALNWAHQIADRFPDGQLYVNLRGYDARPAVAASDALAGLLRGLGVSGQEIPPGTDERAALYRTKLAGRRILIVLDNALEGRSGPLAATRHPDLRRRRDQPRFDAGPGCQGRRSPAGPGSAD